MTPTPPPAPCERSELPTRLGRFRIVSELGRGGCGVVFLAIDPELARKVALKLPRPEALVTPDLRRRFVREARAAAALDHPNLLPVYEAGEIGPVCYIANAYCEGPNLAAWLAGQDRPVPPNDAAALVAALAEGVQHAHDRKIVHRDIKPSNVLLWPATDAPRAPTDDLGQMVPKLSDFGMAKLIDQESSDSRSGAVLGTPGYMAPEQAEGRRKQVGRAADVYALGVILYEMLVGHSPFQGESDLDTLRRVVADEAIRPRRLRPKLPRDLETICLKCLEKDPRRRYASAQALADDLRRFLAGEPILARPTPVWERAGKWAWRRPAHAALAACLTLAALGAWGGILWHDAALQRSNQQLRGAAYRERALADEARTQHILAEQRLWLADRHVYAYRVLSAQQEWDAGRTERALEILETARPAPEERAHEFAWNYLWNLCRREVVFLRGHTAPVEQVAVSPDAAFLASSCEDGTIRLWDLATERCVQVWPGWTVNASWLGFSPDGRLVLARGRSAEDQPDEVRAWRVADGQPLPLDDASDWRLHALTVSPDGRTLAAGGVRSESGPGVLALWDLTTGRRRADLECGPHAIDAVAFSPDGTLLAAGNVNEAEVMLWQMETDDARAAFRLPGHEGGVAALTFSPDSRTLASGGQDGMIRLWDLDERRERQALEIDEGWVRFLSFSPDGKALAAGGPQLPAVRLWDLTTSRLRGSFPIHGDWTHAVAFAPDGRTIATCGQDQTAKVWDVNTGQLRATYEKLTGSVYALAFTPDSRQLVLGCEDPRLRLWKIVDDPAPPVPAGHRDELWGLAFSPDGRTLVSVGNETVEPEPLKFWDLATGRARLELPGHTSTVSCVAYTPDGQILVTGSLDNTVRIWQADGLLLHTLTDHTDRVRALAITPDGQTLATTGSDRTVRIWDLPSGHLRNVLKGHTNTVHALAISPDGTTVASGGNDETIVLWDLASGRRLRTLHATGQVWCLAFSPDGRTLASGSEYGPVTFWDPATGTPRLTLQRHSQGVRTLAFSPDGLVLASGGDDCAVRLWDVASGQDLLLLTGHAMKINALAFAPDGQTLASGSHDGGLILWRIGARTNPPRRTRKS